MVDEESEHGLEVQHFSNYMQAQMKKMWGPVDGLHNGCYGPGKEICVWWKGERETSHWCIFSRGGYCCFRENHALKVTPPATPITTLANICVVSSPSNLSIGTYLASISGQSLAPMYGVYMSSRMALLGTPSIQHMVYLEVQQNIVEKKWILFYVAINEKL